MLKDFPIVAEPYPGEVFPTRGVVYTVREIFPDYEYPALVVEEIINPIDPIDGKEYSWWCDCFREILPPMQAEIKALLEQPELA